jgi:hypothetical protein
VPGSERREQHGCAQSPYIGVLAALLVLIAAALAWTHFGSTSELGLPAGWRFPSALGTPLDPDNMSHWFSRVCRRAGLGHWHLHELRHSAVSLMLAQGTDLYVVSEILGHSSVAVTKTYMGISSKAKSAQLLALMSKALLTPDGSHNAPKARPHLARMLAERKKKHLTRGDNGAPGGVLFHDIADRCRKTYRTQPGLSLGRVESSPGDHCRARRGPLSPGGIGRLRGGSVLDL